MTEKRSSWSLSFLRITNAGLRGPVLTGKYNQITTICLPNVPCRETHYIIKCLEQRRPCVYSLRMFRGSLWFLEKTKGDMCNVLKDVRRDDSSFFLWGTITQLQKPFLMFQPNHLSRWMGWELDNYDPNQNLFICDLQRLLHNEHDDSAAWRRPEGKGSSMILFIFKAEWFN